VNKSELIEAVTDRLGDRKTASTAVEAVVDAITRAVAKGEKVGISGFGVFEKVERAARTARNPSTGAAVKLKKTSVPKFRPGQGFKDIVSGAKKVPPPAKGATRAVTARAGSAASAVAKAPARAAAKAASTTRSAAKAPARVAAKAAGTTRSAAPAAKAPARSVVAKAPARKVAVRTAAAKAPAKAPTTSAATKAPAKSAAAKAPAKKAAKR
jgi:DNA-binding protein HU-beta